jgi:hypothetical protein
MIGSGTMASREPFPGFSSVPGYFDENSSRYDALESVMRKSSRHFPDQLAYTWAKEDVETFVNIYNRRQFWGPSAALPGQLNLHFISDLPFGKDRRWLNRGGVVDQVIGGWTASAVSSPYSAGAPFTIGYSGDTADISVASGRAMRTCGGYLSNPTVQE